MKKDNKGFSLVELIVVIAVMAVLVTVLAPAYLRYVEKSRMQKDISAIGEIVSAIKISANNEKSLPVIPSESDQTLTGSAQADLYDTLVLIEEKTGKLEVTTELSNVEESRSFYESEIVKTVGSEITFNNDELQEYGVDLKVTKDEKYNIHVYLESFNYSPELKAKLLTYFMVYESNDKVVGAILGDWSSQIQEILNAGGFGSGAKALGKLRDLMFNTTTNRWGWEVPDFSSPTEDGQKVLDYVGGEGEEALNNLFETLKNYS